MTILENFAPKCNGFGNSRLIPSSRRNPCPVCSEKKKSENGNCRIGDELVLCHYHPDGDIGHPVWEYVKRSRDGRTGVFAPRRDKRDFDREQWDRHQKERRQKRLEELRALSSIEDKDRANRAILDGLTLSDADRERLRGRGLTDTQIDSIGYKTEGNRILCPITDHRDRMGGIKNWDWDAKDESGNLKPGRSKYYWYVRSGQNRLNDGHLPIAVYGAELSHGVVAFIEGLELKPAIGSSRLNLPVIGSNGSDFVGSWARKKEALEATGASVIRIYPDGGVVVNPQLVEQYRQFIRRAQADGYEVQIAWWGQFLKHAGDIDEIDDRTLKGIQYLTPDEFEQKIWLGEFYRQYQESTRLTQKGSGAKVEAIDVKYLSDHFPDGKGIFRPGKGHGIGSGIGTGKTTALFLAIVKQLAAIGLISLGYRNMLQAQFSAGLERFSDGERTARHVSEVNDFWLNPGQCIRLCLDSLLRLPCWEDETQAIHYFKGKYILLDEVMAILKHLLFSSTLKDKRFEIMKRFILALQQCEGFVYADANLADWAVRFLGEISGKPQEITHNTHQNTKAKLTLLEGTIEGEKIRKNDNFPWLLEMIQAAKQGESFAVASDSQIFIESLESFLIQDGQVKTRIIRIDGKTTERKDIKEFIRDTERVLEEQRGEPVILLFTTSAESGIDIPNRGIFSTVYGFHFGVIESEQFTQMMGRVRDQEAERKVWVRSFSIASDDDGTNFDAEALEYWQGKFSVLQSNLLLGEVPNLVSMAQEIEQELARERKTAYQLKALRNFEKRNLRDCTIQRLLDCGYRLTKVTLDRTPAMDEAKDQFKERKEETKRQNCQDIATACNDFIGKPYKPTSTDATYEERCAQRKGQLRERLPGFWGDEDDPITDYSMDPDRIYLIEYGQPGLVRGLELLHLSQNLDQAKTISQNRYLKMLERGGIVPWDVSTQYLKARALSHLPLMRLIECLENGGGGGGKLSADTAIVKEFIPLLNKRLKVNGERKTLLSVLGKKPSKSPMRDIAHVCKLVGYLVRVNGDPGKETIELDRKKWAELHPMGEDDILAKLKTAIAIRFERLCTGEDFSTRAQKLGPLVRGQAKTPKPSLDKDLTPTKNNLEFIKADPDFCLNTNQENNDNCTDVGAASHPVVSEPPPPPMVFYGVLGEYTSEWESITAYIASQVAALGWPDTQFNLFLTVNYGSKARSIDYLSDEQIFDCITRLEKFLDARLSA